MRFAAFFMSFMLLFHSFNPAYAWGDKGYLHRIRKSLGWSGNAGGTRDAALHFFSHIGLAVVVGTYGVPFVLAKLGFASVGIVGGSFAALWQASGRLPWLFATIQSGAMSGAAASISTKVGVAAAAIKSCFTGRKKKWYQKRWSWFD